MPADEATSADEADGESPSERFVELLPPLRTTTAREEIKRNMSDAVASGLAKISNGITPTKAEIREVRRSCFQTSSSEFGYANQGTDRVFPSACHASRGAQEIRSRIERHGLPSNFISGDSWANHLDDVLHIDICHYPPREEKIRQSGILYLDENGVFGQKSMFTLCSVKVFLGHFHYKIPLKEMQQLVVSSIALMDGISAEGDSDLHTNSSKKAAYDALSYHLFEPSLEIIKEMVKRCRSLKTVTVSGHEMCQKLIERNGFESPLLRRILNACGR